MKSKVKDGIVIGILSAIALVFLTVILVDFSVVFFSLGDIFSYLPSRAIYRTFPEYDVAEEDVECVEIGIRSDSGEYRIRTLSEDETKTYLKNFREARVRVKWTDAVEMFFKGEKHQSGGHYKIVFRLKDGETKELYFTSNEQAGRWRLRVNETNYWVFGSDCHDVIGKELK